MHFTIRRIKDVAGAVDKYERNVAASADDWLDGYKNPRRDPRATAVKAQGRWHNTVSAADTQARYAKNVGDYNVEEAIGVATAVGKDHYVAGHHRRDTDRYLGPTTRQGDGFRKRYGGQARHVLTASQSTITRGEQKDEA